MFATVLARELGMREVIVPPSAGVFSALGMLGADFRYDVHRTFYGDLADIDPHEVARAFADIERGALAQLGDGVGEVDLERQLALRYIGQRHELRVRRRVRRPRAARPRARRAGRAARLCAARTRGAQLRAARRGGALGRMRERFRNCGICGRLTAAMTADHCSERCSELAREGYTSPVQPPAALRPPGTMYEARLIVGDLGPQALPDGFARIGSVGSDPARGELVRVGAESRDELYAALAELVDAVGEGSVQLYTLQRFAAGGLSEPSFHSNGGPS